MEKFQNSISIFDNACNRANEFEQKIQDLSSVVNQSHASVEQITGDVSQMKAKIEEMSTRGHQFEEDILENISISEQSLDKARSAEEKADNILKTFSGLVQKVDGLEKKSSFISEKLTPLENKFLSLESSMNTFEQKSSSSLSEMMEMEKKLSDAINNFNDILTKSDKALSEAKSINQQFNILKSATDSVKEQAEQTMGILNGLTERISRTDRDIKNVEKRSEFMLEIALQKSKAVDIDEELVAKLNKTSSRAEQMYSKVGELKKELETIDKTIKDTLSWAAQKSFSPSVITTSGLPAEDIEIPAESDLPLELDDLLQVLVEHKASDLHLKVGSTPYVRLDSVLIPVGAQVLTEKDTLRLIVGVMTKPQRGSFKKNCVLNFTYTMSGGMRFRINAFYEKGMISSAIKMLQGEIPTFEKINLPVEEFHRLSEFPSGIVLIAGPVLSGKSTTIASIINYINQIKKLHIITIEDSIEFLYRDRKSIISQREIGADTPSLMNGLEQALYQDPDVIVAGEIKDIETLKLVNTAAESGKLVFANVRSDNAVQAIDKLLSLYSDKDANYFRYVFSNNLRAVICQKLIKTEQSGILPVLEILWLNHEIQKFLIQEQYSEIYSLMSEGQNRDIVSFSDFLNNLVKTGKITEEEFIKYRSILTPHLGQEGNKNDSFGDTMLSWL
jgi:twitching motility protein PilT